MSAADTRESTPSSEKRHTRVGGRIWLGPVGSVYPPCYGKERHGVTGDKTFLTVLGGMASRERRGVLIEDVSDDEEVTLDASNEKGLRKLQVHTWLLFEDSTYGRG